MLRNIIELSDGTRISSGSGAQYAIKSCTVTECVNSGKELTIGSTCCACLEATIMTKDEALGLTAGQLVNLYKADDEGNKTKVGIFRLETPTKKSDNVYKVTAYDRITDLDKDLSVWLKGLTGWPYTLIAFAKMVCEDGCGLKLATTSIPNENFPVPQFYKSGVTGRQLMQWIAEIAGRFCRVDADGFVELAWYTDSGVTIQPTGDRYYFAGALTYEDYEVGAIDAVQLRLADSENGALWPANVKGTLTGYDYLNIRSGAGTDCELIGQLSAGDEVAILEQTTLSDGTVWGRIEAGWICITGYMTLETVSADNPYIITGNAILMAQITDGLKPYLEVIKSQLAALPKYKPCKVSLPASLDIRAGHTVQIVDKKGNQITTCVMTKTQTGQRDTLECTGSARRDSATAANNKTQQQLAAEQEVYAQSAAQQALDAQTWKALFDKWTDGGKIQGIFAQDGVWIFNAEVGKIKNLIADLIAAGKLKSVDGKTYFDLDSGKFVSTSPTGDRVVVSGGNITLETSNSVKQVYITRENSQCNIWIFNANGEFIGGVGSLNDNFLVYAPDGSLSGQVVGHPVAWKTINGEKVLCTGS